MGSVAGMCDVIVVEIWLGLRVLHVLESLLLVEG